MHGLDVPHTQDTIDVVQVILVLIAMYITGAIANKLWGLFKFTIETPIHYPCRVLAAGPTCWGACLTLFEAVCKTRCCSRLDHVAGVVLATSVLAGVLQGVHLPIGYCRIASAAAAAGMRFAARQSPLSTWSVCCVLACCSAGWPAFGKQKRDGAGSRQAKQVATTPPPMPPMPPMPPTVHEPSPPRGAETAAQKKCRRARNERRRLALSRSRSQVRRAAGTHADTRDEAQRSQVRRVSGTHADARDESQRSQVRRAAGTLVDGRDESQRSEVRRVSGTHADARDESQRSQVRRASGTHADTGDGTRAKRRRLRHKTRCATRPPQLGGLLPDSNGEEAEVEEALKENTSPAMQAPRSGAHPTGPASTQAGLGEMPPPSLPPQFDDFGHDTCSVCGVDWLLTTASGATWGAAGLCAHCARIPSRCRTDPLRNRFVPFLPEAAPPELCGLTMVEEMTIALELPLMCVSELTPGGQLGYKAHTTVIPQGISNFAKKLPRRRGDLDAHLLTVRKQKQPGGRESGDCWEFSVRPEKLRAALLWLKQHNKYYKDVEIADEHFRDFEDGSCVYGTLLEGTSQDGVDGERESADEASDIDPQLAPPLAPTSLLSTPFAIRRCAGDGDCFFVSVGAATGHTVAELRGLVSASATRERFLHYRGMFNTARTGLADATRQHASVKKLRRGVKSAPAAVCGVSLDVASAELKAATSLFGEFQWMSGVDSVLGFKAKLMTRAYWADAWAVEVVQRELGVKLVIFRDGRLQVDVAPPLPAGWAPTDFVLLRLSGAHYELMHQEEPAKKRFEFRELPGKLRRELRSAGGWFAILAFPFELDGEDLERPDLAAEAGGDATPASGDHSKPPGNPLPADEVASAPDCGGGDGRTLDVQGCDTTGGLVEDDGEGLDMDRLRARLTEAMQRDIWRNDDGEPEPSQPREGVDWPTQGAVLVDEMHSYGTFAKAFPTLFPRGLGDITGVESTGLVKLDDWGQYLMRHSSGCFAQHPRFRYYLFNRMQREKAMQTGNAFHKKYAGDAVSTVDELRELLKEGDRGMAKKLQWWSQNLRGSAAWKGARRSELRDMIATVGLPTFFVTLSAADLHWHHLHAAISKHLGADDIRDSGVRRTKLQDVVHNPHIVSAFFVKRAQLIFAETYGDLIQDSWFVYEWQGRGSVHVHGLLWMRDAPKMPPTAELLALNKKGEISDSACDAKLKEWAHYYGEYISGFNPAVIRRQSDDDGCPAERGPDDSDDFEHAYYARAPVERLPALDKHVCAMQFGELPAADDLKYMANFCNRHTKCRAGVCLKVNKKTKEEYCKAGAPWPRSSEPCFLPSERRRGELDFVPIRNDPLMNNMPRKHFLKWRANADIKPIFSLRALELYLTKYLTKTEVATDDLVRVTDTVMAQKGAEAKASCAYTRVLNQAHNRDYSAQEVTHHCLKFPGVHCSRKFAVASYSDSMDLETGRTTSCAYKQYLDRVSLVAPRYRAMMNDMSFYEFVEEFNTVPPFAKRREPHIPRMMPQVFCSTKADLAKYHEWCDAQLRIHLPHHQFDDVEHYAAANGGVEQALRTLVGISANREGLGPHRLCREWNKLQEEPADDSDSGDDTDDADFGSERQAGTNLPDFAQAGLPCGAHAENAGGGLLLADDWTLAYRSYGVDTSERMKDFISSCKKDSDGASGDIDFTAYDPSKLEGTQVELFKWLQQAAQRSRRRPIRAVIRGGGGVGKSFTINCFRRWLQDHAQLDDDCVAVLAPTGTAAFNVSGRTLHSVLRLPVPLSQATFQKATGPALTALQESFRYVRVVVIDEMSMVGRRMLRALDDRLRQAKMRPHEPFGGLSVFFCGDFGQLPPVADLEMFSQNRKGGSLSVKGMQTWLAFTHSLELTVNHRQKEGGAEFRDALWRLRCGDLTMADYDLIASRGVHTCGDAGFEDAPYLVATHDLEGAHNLERLVRLGQPVFRIQATHTGGKRARDTGDQDAGGMSKTTLLAKGARVMLRVNSWTEMGLTNGAIGEFVDLVAAETGQMPLAALVRFPSYSGPAFFDDDPHLVPIPPNTAHFGEKAGGRAALSRTQLPLQLSWAITIHKSQGQSYDKAVVNLGEKELQLGLTYVALSRLRTLSGLLLKGSYGVGRILRLNTHRKHQARADAEEWLDSLSV